MLQFSDLSAFYKLSHQVFTTALLVWHYYLSFSDEKIEARKVEHLPKVKSVGRIRI